jgi:dolichyl-phosphate beta-glucosyltransferase
MDLSIVIPVYNESRKVAGDIAAASAFLLEQGLTGEIIIADDGSTDGTADLAATAAADCPIEVRIVRLPHRGKGSAVRGGMVQSRGDVAMFADSGVCIPFAAALAGLALLREGHCDIAHGSRRLPGSVISRRQSPYRAALSRLFRVVVGRYMRLPAHLTDTQCGFKLYRGDIARELYGACVTDGFMFDIEIIRRATLRGLRIAEFPVHWRWDHDSRLHPARIAWRVLRELRTIRREVG